MKKYIIAVILFLFPFSILATTIQLNNPLSGAGINDIGGLVSVITGFLRNVAYAVAPVAIIISGYYFLTSAGDPAKIKIAKSIIFWALLGVLIITVADILINIIRNSLGI